jgi:tetratricopeptide (TPR) repeat protein
MNGGIEPLALGGGTSRLLLGADGASTAADAGGVSDGGRLQSTIRRLEGRIREIETTAQGVLEADATRTGVANGKAPAGAGTALSADNGPRAIALAKAQALMNLGKADAALKVLEEAVATSPRDAELRLRQGLALERLQRLDQAIEAFDEAISLDATSTQAYLAKGGVLNRQQRYQEALACYEQALERRPQA